MTTFELDPTRETPGPAEAAEPLGLGTPVFLSNVRWFIRIRWIMVGVCLLFGLLCVWLPDTLRGVGLIAPRGWPWALAGMLLVANAVFAGLALRLTDTSPRRTVEANIWLQIVVDLALITFAVHVVGSTCSLIAFAYLFHIALAGIFFSPRKSLLVFLMSAFVYVGCVSLQMAGALPVSGILITSTCPCQQDPHIRALFAGSAVAVWLLVWYLVSTLSKAVRQRDQQLDAANRRIVRADQEQNRQVLRTTHDLKAPFSGIESSIRALRASHWADIPDSARAVIERIERRAERLRKRISDILLLGELRSETISREHLAPLELGPVLDDVAEQLARRAEDRQVSLRMQAPAVTVFGDRKQLTIMLSNLVSNAISYSNEGGDVTVSVAETDDAVRVTVADRGVGIRADALPHIFEDYFRTKEAAAYNKMSTGLGLAIVKKIAAKFDFRISVTSKEGKGTTFEVTIPKHAPEDKQRRHETVAKIKIIDDDVEQAEDLAAVLSKAGHTVSILDHTEGAVEDLKRDRPDLLVLDVMFPENPSAGLELAVQIRQSDETKDLPVILLTGVNQEFPLELSSKDIDDEWMPVQEFIEKPVDPQQLLEKVDTLLSRRQTA